MKLVVGVFLCIALCVGMAKSYLFAAGQPSLPIGAGGLGQRGIIIARWSDEENNMLRRFVEGLRQQIEQQLGPQTEQQIVRQIDWKAIARKIGNGRKTRDCREYYNNYLAPATAPKPWTSEEDQLLVAKYRELGSRWTRIVAFFPERTDRDVRNRFKRLEHNSFESPSNEAPIHNSWTKEENEALLEIAGRYKGRKNWQAIAIGMGNGRTANQYKWHWQFLTREDTPTAPWTPEEDQTLLDIFGGFGPQWDRIAVLFGRTWEEVRDRHTLLSQPIAPVAPRLAVPPAPVVPPAAHIAQPPAPVVPPQACVFPSYAPAPAVPPQALVFPSYVPDQPDQADQAEDW
jgi:hypothetical protein